MLKYLLKSIFSQVRLCDSSGNLTDTYREANSQKKLQAIAKIMNIGTGWFIN